LFSKRAQQLQHAVETRGEHRRGHDGRQPLNAAFGIRVDGDYRSEGIVPIAKHGMFPFCICLELQISLLLGEQLSSSAHKKTPRVLAGCNKGAFLADATLTQGRNAGTEE
jgi:hypothetical protein